MFYISGDDLYPETPDYVKTVHSMEEYKNNTFDELRRMYKKRNRYEFKDYYNYELICNIPGCDGHRDLFVNAKAKL